MRVLYNPDLWKSKCRLAHSKLLLGAHRLERIWGFDLARRWDERPEERDELGWQLAAAKLIVTNAVLRSTDLALRVSGSAGLSHRSPLQRHFRDARTSLGHPPMEDVVLTVVGRAALGLDAEGKVRTGG